MLVAAHLGHYVGLGFAVPPLATVAGLAIMTMRERRREERDGEHPPRD